MPLRLVVMFMLQPSSDLLGRPIARQATADESVHLWPIQLALQRALAAPPLGLGVGAGRVILAPGGVSSQLARDRTTGAIQCLRDLALLTPLVIQLRYPIAFFWRKMMSHRWDSFPKGAFTISP